LAAPKKIIDLSERFESNKASAKSGHYNARTPHEQTGLQRQIEATDRQTDAPVYELYGLTEEEIWIADGGVRP
jgi:hypothetical protein